MNQSITTNSLKPIEEHKPGPKPAPVTSNKVQPARPADPGAARERYTGQIITSHNLEQIQEENAKAAAKKGGKGK